MPQDNKLSQAKICCMDLRDEAPVIIIESGVHIEPRYSVVLMKMRERVFLERKLLE